MKYDENDKERTLEQKIAMKNYIENPNFIIKIKGKDALKKVVDTINQMDHQKYFHLEGVI